MRKVGMLVALSTMLLWAGAVHASNKGGLPACQARLNESTANLLGCTNELSVAELCGNDVIDSGEQCDQGNLNGKTCVDLGFVGGTLKCGADCVFDTSGCFTTRFTDNGDGTISDHKTGLMWEKKSPAGSDNVHDVNNTYTWCVGEGDQCTNAKNESDGTAFTTFLYGLNGGTTSNGGNSTTGCFAGHCDWRLPLIEELTSIVDPSAPNCGAGGVCIAPIFGPTKPELYWSETTDAGTLSFAWYVDFSQPNWVAYIYKVVNGYVRAVRKGQ